MKKRMIRAVGMIVMVMVFMLTGCTSNKNQSQTSKSSDQGKNTIFEITDRLTDIPSSFFWYYTKQDCVYAISFREDDSVDDSTGSRISNTTLYKLDNDGNIIREQDLSKNLNSKAICSEIYFDEEENMYFIQELLSEDTEQTELVKLDSKGEISASVNITETLDLSQDETISELAVDADGTVALFLKNTIFLFDQNLKDYEKIAVTKGNICNLALSKEDKFLCILEGNNGYEVASIDLETKKIGTPHPIDIAEYPDVVNGIGDYDFYYRDEYGVFGYDMAQESSVKILDYMLSDITRTDIIPLSDGKFIGETELDDEQNILVFYSKKKEDSDNNCKIITLGTMSSDSDLNDFIHTFNQMHSDLAVEVKDYSVESDPVAKMNIDMISGNGPDILDLSDLSAAQYVGKGVLEDLSPFYENDPELDEKDLLPSVLEAMKKDDKLFYVAAGFDVESLAAKKSENADSDGWTYSEFSKYLESQSSDAQLCYLNSKQYILRLILGHQSADFVDYNTGECYFDCDDFKNMLRACNERGSDSDDYEWEEDERTLLQKGSILLKDTSTDFDTFKDTLAVFDEDVNLIGYPSSDKHGNYIIFHTQLGISAKSEYKQEAWEVLRMLMTKEYQGTQLNFHQLPTRQDCFDLWMEAQMTKEDYTNEMGREISAHRGEVDMDGYTYQTTPFTEAQANLYIDMINRAVKVMDYNPDIMKIVEEEAGVYFAGDCDLDTTASIIQNRVSTYVNEQR